MTKACNILLSSAGRRVALLRHFRESLKDLNLVGRVMAADLTPWSSAFQAADEGFFSPQFSSDDFVPRILQICREQKVRLLVPTLDPELKLYADHEQAFREIGTHVAVSSPETVRIGGDKQATHDWLSRHDFPVPRQTTREMFEKQTGEWDWPVLIKPRHGSSSVGVHVVHNQAELDVLAGRDECIIQSLARGKEYTIDVYVDQTGQCRCAVPRLRLETRGGEISKGLTIRHEKLQQLARRIIEKLPGVRGVLNIQVFYDEANQTMQVIEINPRFGGGYPLAHAAGATYTHWLVEETMGLPLSAAADAWQDRLAMLRYDDAVFASEQALKQSMKPSCSEKAR